MPQLLSWGILHGWFMGIERECPVNIPRPLARKGFLGKCYF